MDFALADDERFDAAVMKSGEQVEIHLQARFHARVERPHFGFSLKTLDGVMLYALNTCFDGLTLPPADPGDVVSCKFSLPLRLQRGDYFLDLGVDEQTGGSRFMNLHRRCSVAHLQVLEDRQFNGLVDLEASFTETARLRNAARAA